MTGERLRKPQQEYVRVPAMSGRFLLSSASRTDVVTKALDHTGRDFSVIVGDKNDPSEQTIARVVDRIKGVVGLRGAIKVVDQSLLEVTEISGLNQIGATARGLIEGDLRVIQDNLADEREIQRREARFREAFRQADELIRKEPQSVLVANSR